MQPPAEAQVHYAQRRLAATTAASVAARQWATVDPAAVVASWGRQVPAVAMSVAGGQFMAASAADPYVASVLAADGGAPAGAAVVASAFAGAAADGRDLASLLMVPAVTTLAALRRPGTTADDALALGGAQLATMVRTEVADAGRLADQVATTAAPAAAGYVRIVVGATCNRCIVLAGRVYRWSEGFDRHPNCDCQMLPVAASQAAGFVQSPQRVYASMSPEQRSAAGWSQAEQAAIDAGADISAVTNIHRKGALYTAGGLRYTREGTTRRALFGGYEIDPQTGVLRKRARGERAPGRMTPESIYRVAGSDRELALRLLRRFGYLR